MICRRYQPYARFILPAASVFAFTTFAGIARSGEVTATRLDGTTITGELRQWDNQQVLLSTPAGEQRIATDKIVSLRPQPADNSPASSDKSSGLAELIDGSNLPIQSIDVEKTTATLTLAQPGASGDKTLSVPTEQLAAVRFRHLDPSLATQWDELGRLKLANDVLAVLKKDGKSLDYVEGVLGDVSADKVAFKLEGEIQRVDRSKIAGVIYYRPDRRTQEEPRAIIQGRSGLRVRARRVELADSLLRLTTAAGTKLTWPLADIRLADFSAGKLMYLSDIEPASENWTPLVGLPPAATIAAEYGQPRRDKSAHGGPLALLINEGDSAHREGEAPAEPNNDKRNGLAGALPSPAFATGMTRSFNKGLALRSRTEIVYRLPAGYQRFLAIAGIDPATSAAGNVRLVISGDDLVLLDTEIAGDQAPHPIQLEIANVKRLKIRVDYGQNLDTGDWLNLCDARIVK